jgi:hypothetical protein
LSCCPDWAKPSFLLSIAVLQPAFIDHGFSGARTANVLAKNWSGIEDEWRRFERSKAVIPSQGRKVAPE